MKTYFIVFLVFLLPLKSLMAITFIVDSINYKITSSSEPDTVAVANNLYEGNIIIPSQIIFNNIIYTVTSIGNSAFSGYGKLTSITIPSSIISIGDSAFRNCGWLTSLDIPKTVKSIGVRAFSGCSGLTAFSIPDSITSINNGTFYSCYKITSLVIPSSVTYIAPEAFVGCSGLTNIFIPTSVTKIGNNAFENCRELTTIHIPDFVTTIDSAVFENCISLNSIILGKSVKRISGRSFFNCSKLLSIELPDSLISIGNYAFYNCSGLTSITIPNLVTRIGNAAFIKCSSLTSIAIPNTVNFIGTEAFNYCSGLNSVTLPNTINIIDYLTFGNCTRLKSIIIPNSVTKIGMSAFANSGLTSFDIPNSVITIYENAYQGCKGLTKIFIPNSVTSIWNNAFSSCSNLTSVTFSNSLKTLGSYAFSNCISLDSIVLPVSLDAISNNLFTDCNLLNTISIPNSITIIGNQAFKNCVRLTNLNIPNSVTGIGTEAFIGCTGLTTVILPNSLKNIGNGSFNGCTGLMAINIPSSVITLGSQAFQGCKGLTTVNIPSSVKTIGSEAFMGCKGIYSFKIPNSISIIESNVFTGCAGLTSIDIPSSIKQINSFAFYHCTGLKYITCHANIPPLLSTITNSEFMNVPKTIPLNVPIQSVYLYKNTPVWKDFNVRGIVPIIGTGHNQVSGNVFLDDNLNGVKDSLEPSISNQLILLLPDSIYTLTDDNGNYFFRLDSGKYNIQLLLKENWQLKMDSIYTIIIKNSDASDFNFGIKDTKNELKLETHVTALHTSRCAVPISLYITYKNTGTNISNGTLVFLPDKKLKTILSSLPKYDSIKTDTGVIYWNYKNLKPFEQRSIILSIRMPDFNSIGDTLISVASIINNDSIQYSDISKIIVLCSYDPNDKIVDPAGVQEKNYTLMNEALTYTIQFQNTGNDTAYDIIILDYLDPSLDLRTFKVIAASHNLKTSFTNNKAIEFRFDNIMLIDSSKNELKSQGFVKYRINPVSKLPEETVVNNKAFIYFDYNPPIITNTVFNTYTSTIPNDITGLKKEMGKNEIFIYPNPAHNFITLDFNFIDKIKTIEILNSLGQVVYTKQTGILNKNIKINISELPTGIFLIKVQSNKSTFIKKFIKE